MIMQLYVASCLGCMHRSYLDTLPKEHIMDKIERMGSGPPNITITIAGNVLIDISLSINYVLNKNECMLSCRDVVWTFYNACMHRDFNTKPLLNI